MPVKITSKYTPLTYDEITKPLIQATEAQMAMENAYMDVQDKASAAMAQANQEIDPIAYSKLKSYAEDLQAQADSLMRYGLQRSSRQSLLNMRRRYGEEITPITAAIERRNALSEEQRKLQASNPYLRHERDMRTVSLDAMLNNPNMDYGRSIDLSDVQKRAATLVKAMGQGRTDVKYGKQLDRYTKEVLMREGFTPEEIQAALSNDDNANQALSAALDNLYASTGADSFRAGVDSEVWDAIQQGAMMGAGEVKATIHADEEAKRRDTLADRAHSEAFQRELYGIRYGDNSTSESAGGVTATKIGYYTENGQKVEIFEDANGNRYTKEMSANGKIKRFVPTDKQPTATEFSHTRAEQAKTQAWRTTNGGYVTGFDEDDDYGPESKNKLVSELSKYENMDNSGVLKGNVKSYTYDESLSALNASEREKLAAALDNSGLSPEELTVVVVHHNDWRDDDVFVVKTDALDAYETEARQKRGITASTSGYEDQGLSGEKAKADKSNSGYMNYFTMMEP